MKNDLWDVIKKYVIREGNMPLKLWQPEDDLPREFQFLSKHIQSVLIVGERGTGKEGMAEDICFNHWHANEECYKPQNCAALDSNLAKAALFGYIKGAFTGAERTTPGLFWKSLTEAQIEEIWVSKTHSGVDIKNLHKEVASSKHVVYFLDELHHLSLENQAALLRLIESHQFAPMGLSKLFVLKGEYEPKIIAAVQPHALNDENKFMPDLRDRFEYMHEINPLRDRPTTIPRLILIRALQEITKNIQDKHEREQIVAQFLSKVMVRWTDLCRMLIYSWPGNVRELVRLVKHAVLINAAESHNGILDFTLNKIGQESNIELKYIFKKMHDDSNCERWGSSSHSLQQRLESGVFLPVWKTERTNKAAAFSTAQIDELRKCLDEHNNLRFQPDYGRIVDFICARVNYALKIGPMQGSTDKNEFDLKIRKEVNEMYEKLAEAAKQGKIKISGRFDTNVILEGMNDYYETFKKDCSQDKDGNAKDSSNRFDDDYFVDAAVNSCLRDIEAAPHDDVPDYKSIVKQLFVYIDKHTSGASVNYDSIVDIAPPVFLDTE